MALRDEIADVVTDATDERHNRTVLGDYDPIDEDGYVERITALFREAMTSEAAVGAAESKYWEDCGAGWLNDMGLAITAALDAITGPARESPPDAPGSPESDGTPRTRVERPA